jgi:hypothetical protein
MERKFDDIKNDIVHKKSNPSSKPTKPVESKYNVAQDNTGNEYAGMNSALLNQ